MKYHLLLLLMTFAQVLNKCSNFEDQLIGHWYLTKSSFDITNSEYIEMKIGLDSSFLNKDGMYWYRANIEYSSNSIKIKKFIGNYQIINNDSLVIFDSYGSNQFKRITGNSTGLTSRDLEMIRRFKYYANHLTRNDSMGFEMINNNMWYHFGERHQIDSLEQYEDIQIVPKYK